MAKEIKIINPKELKPKNIADGLSFLSLLTKSREHVDTVTVGMSTIDAGKHFTDVYYEDCDETLYQLEGDAEITLEGGKTTLLHPGMVLHIPRGAKYDYKSLNKNRHLVIWVPAYDHYD
ncbi:cupin domain-containing protein [Chloroflexota bacterium]